MEYVLQTQSLTKRYDKIAAVDNVTMDIKKGDIYGLIGRNGAGKTTLIRMITSLTMPDSGEIRLFGQDHAKLNEERKRIGCVIEIPALYPNLTAIQNLEYYRILRGIPDKKVTFNSLELVGLKDTGKKKFKNFSLGMKQRLGLALAIMNNPDFIILDEPTNGLDPIGIIEMRETLKRLNEDLGITILISSHILTELSQIATKYGIINNGKMIKQLTAEELKDQCKQCLYINVNDTSKATSIIETVLKITNFKVISGKEIRIYDYLDDPAEVTYQLNAGGVRVSSAQEMGENLEDYFKSLVGEDK